MDSNTDVIDEEEEEKKEDSDSDDDGEDDGQHKLDVVNKEVEETQGGFKNELERQAKDEEEKRKKRDKLNRTLDEQMELNTTQLFSRLQLLTFLK